MKVIMASTSTVYGSDYLAYLQEPLKAHFKEVKQILFIPFARPSGITHDAYLAKAQEGLSFLNKEVIGLHQQADFKEAIQNAQAIFTGGGNTFLLVDQLYKYDLWGDLKSVIQSGAPYLGTSAGSNICGQNMKTTNDMPIIHPPHFDTLGLVPFNVNVHYLDPDPASKHKGETRETRIKEFQNLNKLPVVGLREGSWLNVTENDIVLEGPLQARIFMPGKEAYEIASGSSLKSIK